MLHRALALTAAASLLAPALAAAKPWKGVTPGKSTRADVESRWGKPPLLKEKAGDCAATLTYNADQKPEGAKEVQVCVDAAGKVTQLRVFPDAELDRGTVEEAFGDEYRKKLSDEFIPYWHYEKDGLVVFFEKGGKKVKVLLYIEGKAHAKKPPSHKADKAEGDEGAE